MLRSINSKFYTVVILLLALFSTGFVIVAYFFQQQSEISEHIQNAMSLKTDIETLNETFHEARHWEKVILYQSELEAENHFGESLQQIRSLLVKLERNELNVQADISFKTILVDIDRYEQLIGEVIQLNTVQLLLDTRLISTFQSMNSTILHEQNESVLYSVFGIGRYFVTYLRNRDISEYNALKAFTESLEKKYQEQEKKETRLLPYLEKFDQILEENYSTWGEILTANRKVDEISGKLIGNLEKISSKMEVIIDQTLQSSHQNRSYLRNLFIVLTIFGSLVLLIILRLLRNNIIGPVGSIARVISHVQNGDMRARFQHDIKEKDEILEMGMSLNNMLESIEVRDKTLQEYQETLEEKLEELSRRKIEQERLALKLQRIEKMEAVGSLAGGVAHELNNILSGVVSYPELLLLDMPEESPYRKPLEKIRTAGKRAVDTVQDLLTLSRRGAAVIEIIQLNTLITHYLASHECERLKTEHPEIVIKTSLANDLFNIEGSKNHLLKTLINLVTNGIESIEQSGVLSITTENRYLSKPLTHYDEVVEGDYATLIVRDSGQGISAVDLEHIFEPFFTKKEMGRSGTGLGLAVVWGTVMDHKGYIDVESSESEGTTFTLYFPASREEVEENASKRSIESLMGNGESILVVDDVEQQRDIASRMLEKLGYTVSTAASGEEAVVHLKQEPADLLVLDMLMPPGIDGLETYQQVIAIYPGQKAIIASGYSESERVHEAQRLGVAAYVRKPYSIDTIGLAIKSELER